MNKMKRRKRMIWAFLIISISILAFVGWEHMNKKSILEQYDYAPGIPTKYVIA